MDYQMSLKFGFDWKKQSYKRMRAFMEIMSIEPAVKASIAKQQKEDNSLPNGAGRNN